MRGLLIGIGAAVAVAGFTAAPAPAQRAPATFIPPTAGDERFLESWFGAELSTAGLKPLWTPTGLEGFRARYRLLYAGGSRGVTIVTIDVDEDGSGVVVQTRKRPGGIVERDQHAFYVPGKVAWADRREVNSGPIRRLQRMFDAQHFFSQSFRPGNPIAEEMASKCSDGVSYLIEVRDRTGYNAITRNSCDVADVSGLIEAVMQLGGGWPRR
jgi:hypothetical protein